MGHKKKHTKTERRGLPGGPNEMYTYVTGVFSTEGYKSDSPDVNNPFNIIPSGDITMKGVNFPVLGTDNLGNTQAMIPGNDYSFPGDTVLEIPMAQDGEEIIRPKGDSYEYKRDGDKFYTRKTEGEWESEQQPGWTLASGDAALAIKEKVYGEVEVEDDRSFWQRVKDMRSERLEAIQELDTSGYGVKVIQYPYGHKNNDPGHIEAVLFNKETGELVNDIPDSDFKGYINRWARQGNKPVKEYNYEGDESVRVVDLSLPDDDVKDFIYKAQLFMPSKEDEVHKNLGINKNVLPVSGGDSKLRYDFLESNCATGVCLGLGMNPDAPKNKNADITDPNEVMDNILTTFSDYVTDKSGERTSRREGIRKLVTDKLGIKPNSRVVSIATEYLDGLDRDELTNALTELSKKPIVKRLVKGDGFIHPNGMIHTYGELKDAFKELPDETLSSLLGMGWEQYANSWIRENTWFDASPQGWNNIGNWWGDKADKAVDAGADFLDKTGQHMKNAMKINSAVGFGMFPKFQEGGDYKMAVDKNIKLPYEESLQHVHTPKIDKTKLSLNTDFKKKFATKLHTVLPFDTVLDFKTTLPLNIFSSVLPFDIPNYNKSNIDLSLKQPVNDNTIIGVDVNAMFRDGNTHITPQLTFKHKFDHGGEHYPWELQPGEYKSKEEYEAALADYESKMSAYNQQLQKYKTFQDLTLKYNDPWEWGKKHGATSNLVMDYDNESYLASDDKRYDSIQQEDEYLDAWMMALGMQERMYGMKERLQSLVKTGYLSEDEIGEYINFDPTKITPEAIIALNAGDNASYSSIREGLKIPKSAFHKNKQRIWDQAAVDAGVPKEYIGGSRSDFPDEYKDAYRAALSKAFGENEDGDLEWDLSEQAEELKQLRKKVRNRQDYLEGNYMNRRWVTEGPSFDFNSNVINEAGENVFHSEEDYLNAVKYSKGLINEKYAPTSWKQGDSYEPEETEEIVEQKVTRNVEESDIGKITTNVSEDVLDASGNKKTYTYTTPASYVGNVTPVWEMEKPESLNLQKPILLTEEQLKEKDAAWDKYVSDEFDTPLKNLMNKEADLDQQIAAEKHMMQNPDMPEGYAIDLQDFHPLFGHYNNQYVYTGFVPEGANREEYKPNIPFGKTQADFDKWYEEEGQYLEKGEKPLKDRPKGSRTISASFQKGGSVSQIWQDVTGTPWSQARAQGLTDGSYAANIELRNKLISTPSKFKQKPSNSLPPANTNSNAGNATLSPEEINDKINSSKDFNSAFRIARDYYGPNKIFEYNAKQFGTNLAGETFEPSEEDMINAGLKPKQKEKIYKQNRSIVSPYTDDNVVEFDEYEDFENIKKNNSNLNRMDQADLIVSYQLAHATKPYLILDENAGRMHLYYPGEEQPIESYPILSGSNAGDAQTVTKADYYYNGVKMSQDDLNTAMRETGAKSVDALMDMPGYSAETNWDAGNKTTGAGKFTIGTVNEDSGFYDDSGQNRKTPSFVLKNEGGNEVSTVIHTVPSSKSANRINALTQANPADMRMTNGCINGMCTDLIDMHNIHDVGEGTEIFILPEDDGNKFVYQNGQLNFRTTNKNRQMYQTYTDEEGNEQRGQGVNRTKNTLNYKPIKIDVDKEAFANDKFTYFDFNDEDEYNRVVVPFAKSLEDNKQDVMKVMQVDGDAYNDIAKVAFGILGNETNFGDTHSAVGNFGRAVNKYFDRSSSSSPDYMSKYETYGADQNENSAGLTQFRWKWVEKDAEQGGDLKQRLKTLGITSNKDFLNAEKAALGTVAILSYYYNNRKVDDIMQDLPRHWAGVIERDPDRKVYTKNVANNSKYFTIKEKSFQKGGGLDNDVLIKQAYAESTFRPKVTSSANAKGLTQIRPDVLSDYIKAKDIEGDVDLTDVSNAVDVQKWYMNDLYNASFIDKENQTDEVRIAKTLAAYNWGRGNLVDFLNEKKGDHDIYKSLDWVDKLPKETKDYVNKILGNNEQFNKDYDAAVNNEKYTYILNEYKRIGGEISNLKIYRDYVNGMYDGKSNLKKAEAIYDKLNRVYYQEAGQAGMSAPNYIMSYLDEASM